MGVTLATCACLAVALLHAAPLAAADPKPPPAAAEARDLFVRGFKAYRRKEWNDAYRDFLAAWRFQHEFQIAGKLGECALRTGRYRDAAEFLSFALREPADTMPQGEAEKLRPFLDEALTHVAAVNVDVNGSGAEVKINGVRRGLTPQLDPFFVEPGHVDVEVHLAGYMPQRKSVEAEAGKAYITVVRLEPDVAARAAAVAAERGDAASQSTSGLRTPILVAGAGLAVAAAATGAGLLVVSGNTGTEADALLAGVRRTGQLCPQASIAAQCSDLLSARRDQDDQHNVGVALLAAAGAVGVGTVLYGLWGPSGPRDEQTASTSPWFGPGTAGVTVTTSF